MSITSMMVQRCDIRRNKQTVKSGYNVLEPASYIEHLTNVPCKIIPQVSNVRGMGGMVGEGSDIALRDSLKRVVRIILPKDTDITERDRIFDIRTRDGTIVEAGPVNPLLIRPADKAAAHHINVIAERVF